MYGNKHYEQSMWGLTYHKIFPCPTFIISDFSLQIISMAWCKTAVSPLPIKWRYCSLALNHQHMMKKNLPKSSCLTSFTSPGPSVSGICGALKQYDSTIYPQMPWILALHFLDAKSLSEMILAMQRCKLLFSSRVGLNISILSKSMNVKQIQRHICSFSKIIHVKNFWRCW